MKEINRLTDRAYQLFEDKKFSESLDCINEAEEKLKTVDKSDISEEEINTLKSSMLNFKGFNFLGLGNTETARECFEKAIDINPNSSQGCAGLGEVFYLNDMDTEAKIMFEWAIDYNPLNQFAISGLAKVNKNLQLPANHNTLNVETTLKKGKRFYTILSEAYQYFNDNLYEFALKKIDEAESLFALNLKSNQEVRKIATLENFRGFTYLALEDIENAQVCFEKALNFNPDSSQACAGLGEVFFLKGEDNKAKTMFEWGVMNNRANEFAKQGLAKVNINLNLSPEDNSLLKG